MLKFAKFIGANTDFATAQAFLFPRFPQGSETTVFGLVVSGEGEDVFVQVRQRILNLEEIFNTPFERVTDKLHEVFELLKKGLEGIENLQITLFCTRDNLFYVLQAGNNLVEVLGNEGRRQIIQPDYPSEKIISGFIKEGERVLLLSTKIENKPWGESVIKEVFGMPFAAISDAEVIFAKDEGLGEQVEDLAGVKNIQPVAFILIESETEGKITGLNPEVSRVNKGVKLNFGLYKPLLFLRKITRQAFRVFRLVYEKVPFLNIQFPKVSKKIFIVAFMTLLLSLGSFGWYFYQKSKESERNIRVDNLVTIIQSSLDEAISISETDQKATLTQLKKAEEKLNELVSLDPKNDKVAKIKGLFDDKSDQLRRIYKNFELEHFLSLNLIRENFTSKKMSFSVNKLLLLDEVEKSLVAVDLKLKTPTILAGKTQLGDAKYASINGSNAFAFSQDKGIIHIDLDTNKSSSVASHDEGWGEIRDIFGFSDNVYVLDSGKTRESGMIWKYAPTLSGFSQKQTYLKAATGLSESSQLMIDYSVWVLTSEPDLIKFTAGNKDFYALSGLEEPISQIDRVYVTEELDSVFLLDKSKKRILITKKNGEYLAQYIKDEFSKVDDFFVDEEGKEIYLLMENKIYKTALE